MLKFFDFYVSQGLKPIAVYKRSKRPVGKGWNKNWSVSKWRPCFETDRYNMGIILGDVVDVEGDCPESNALLLELIGDVARPKWGSSKSTHNLFLSPDPYLTRVVVHGIEFRGKNHQSVVPPSSHKDGPVYGWLSGSVWPPPPMPPALKQFYLDNKPSIRRHRAKKRLKDGFIRTHCNICKGGFFIHERRLLLEVRAFQEYRLPWMCHGCREIDMRDSCRRLRKEMEKVIPYSEPLASILENIPDYRIKR